MPDRDRFTIKLVCQLCWILADARVSVAEGKDPDDADGDFRVDYCPTTFRVTRETGITRTTQIVCANCGDVVRGH
ncbi:hypothetical protein GXW78_26950 [Roseomonas terrae]|uniref:Uncharacterized protein n=1 Tax=Neoroseomonas terrae TaxID=424799 RepID=A0ABS5EQL1_9PROT|nr:hypothetical protein [Neoroseomonas terrae]MBR0653321.1 hypothetical protein [Neoroseomonas terrae]